MRDEIANVLVFWLQGSVLERPLLVKLALAHSGTQFTLFESLDNWDPGLGIKQLLLPRSEVLKPAGLIFVKRAGQRASPILSQYSVTSLSVRSLDGATISRQEDLPHREVAILAAQGALPPCVVVEKADTSAHPSFDADPRGETQTGL
jgi:hypothetical protein